MFFNLLNINKANAGIISFLVDLLTPDNLQEESMPVNSQTINLLTAALTPDNSQKQDSANIINNNSILADAGPIGTINNISSTTPPSDQISIYTVRQGDTLSEIAKMFNVSVNTIRWANNITSSKPIQEGDILIILPITGVKYTIKKGDTLKNIAAKYNGDIDEIINYNEINPKEDLKEGQTIIIPNGDIPQSQQAPSLPRQQKTYAGYYIRPIEGGRKSQGLHGYNAVDLANTCGTPVYASASGNIILSRNSGWNGGYGKLIIISHPNGTQTLYAHLSKTVAQNGWYVTQGQLIGYVGTTGHSTGCHLHFEIRGAKNPF